MRWYKHLYIGETARVKRYKIVGKLRYHKLQRDAYVITLPSNDNNLLDIFPSYILLQEYYKKQDLLIIGIASGYEEALEIAKRIVHEVYHSTSGFDIKTYIGVPSSKSKNKP